MTRDPEHQKNLDGYNAPPISWKRVRDHLDSGITQAPDTSGNGAFDKRSWKTGPNSSAPPCVNPATMRLRMLATLSSSTPPKVRRRAARCAFGQTGSRSPIPPGA
jgi:hypothetical protein